MLKVLFLYNLKLIRWTEQQARGTGPPTGLRGEGPVRTLGDLLGTFLSHLKAPQSVDVVALTAKTLCPC